MSKQYAVIGLGKFGFSVATTLAQAGKEVLAVDKDAEPVQEIADLVTYAARADITDSRVFASLGISNMDVVIVGISENMESSILATLQAKEAGVPLVIAKCMSQMHANILKKVGADRVVMAESETGIRLGKSLISGGFQDFFLLSDSFSLVELPGWNFRKLPVQRKTAGSAEEIQYQRNRRQGRGRHPCHGQSEDAAPRRGSADSDRRKQRTCQIDEKQEMRGPFMITSSSNAQVKNIIALNKKAKERREQDVFVAEGWKMFQEAPREWLKKVYVSESGSKMHEIPSDGTEYEVVDDRVFQSMCDTKTPQGVLSVIRMPHYTEEEVMDNGKTPLLMVLEDLQDPGNVGTIIRTAEGAGVTGIIMSRGTADIFNPKTIRSTMGSIYRMPFLIVDDAVGFVKGLKARKICTYAAHLHGVHSYREEDYTKGTAFLIGNEGNGLTDAMAEAAECLIRIPMEGKVESLNAAIASAVLMYEAHGQRA